MQRPGLILVLLFVAVLALSGLVLRQDALRGRENARSVMAVLLGDGRRLFANHFLAKADAYFHRGLYPSIFEVAQRERGNHLVESLQTDAPHAGHDHDEGHVHGPECDHVEEARGEAHEDACAHAQPAQGPQDWIALLAARFQPDQHVHLEGGEEKEMLPWVRLAVEMDPHNVEAYTVGGYWLRQLGKAAEAEAFLREGQRNNPDSYEIYFELGRLAELGAQDPDRAVRLYRLAAEKWQAANAGLKEPDTLALAQILGRMGKVHEAQGQWELALQDYTLLKRISHSPEGVQRLIEAIQERLRQTNEPVGSPKPERSPKSDPVTR
jgi:tetratricopeptide (TPR) repeat protein